MRTTLNIEDDVLAAARSLAAAEGRPVGSVVSELARRGLQRPAQISQGPSGFPVVRVDASAALITTEMVRNALEDEI